MPVHYTEGAVHGFLALRTLDGKVLASGDLTQIIRGKRAISHLVFRFKDGSLDDETAVFTQQGHFRLISDRHIQKGPAFPKPVDVSIDVAKGEVITRYMDKDEKKVDRDHLDLPPDLANGILLDVFKNIDPNAKEFKLSYLASTPKPKLVKISIKSEGPETFGVVGSPRKSTRFTAKIELGGLTGMLAQAFGKQPADTNVWIAGGEAPAFVKSEGPLYASGPVWSIQMTSPAWREPAASRR